MDFFLFIHIRPVCFLHLFGGLFWVSGFLEFSICGEFLFFLWVVYFLGLWVNFVLRDWLKYDREKEESRCDTSFGVYRGVGREEVGW
jgi:hypothetical protein